MVIYDHLVHPALLDVAPEHAERIDVGSAAPEQRDQDAISYLVAEKAREGKTVARLKWGDPFLFDQAGEEALFLHEQGVPYEVVPGIPHAIGASAYAGVPITYQGAGDTVTFVRGHEDDGREKARIDWAALATLDGTIVSYAGPRQLPRMLHGLIDHGRSPDEPAAIVVHGTLSSQRTMTGTLRELADAVAEEPVGAALLIVGRVVNFRDHLRWFDARPLFGRRALIMHSKEQPDDLADLLRSQGAEVVSDIDSNIDVYRLLLDRKVDLVTFTSASAVLNFAANFGADQVSDLLAHTVVAVQGTAAADAATRANISPVVQEPAGSSAGFVESIVSRFRGN